MRVDLDDHDRRIFVPTPQDSPSRQRGYNRRSSMEQNSSSLDHGFNLETRYIRGLAKTKTRIGLAPVVMMALALGRVRVRGCVPGGGVGVLASLVAVGK